MHVRAYQVFRLVEEYFRKCQVQQRDPGNVRGFCWKIITNVICFPANSNQSTICNSRIELFQNPFLHSRNVLLHYRSLRNKKGMELFHRKIIFHGGRGGEETFVIVVLLFPSFLDFTIVSKTFLKRYFSFLFDVFFPQISSFDSFVFFY